MASENPHCKSGVVVAESGGMELKALPILFMGEHGWLGKRSWTSRWQSSSRLDASKDTSTGEDIMVGVEDFYDSRI